MKTETLVKASLIISAHNANAKRFNSLVQRAANAWARGNNSGDSATMEKMDTLRDKLRAKAVAMLPHGSKVTWPGLYPVITRLNRSWNCVADWQTFAN